MKPPVERTSSSNIPFHAIHRNRSEVEARSLAAAQQRARREECREIDGHLHAVRPLASAAESVEQIRELHERERVRTVLFDELKLPIDRFRANLIISGLPAYEEDFVDTLERAELSLKLVKPCARCSVPSVDQLTGEQNGPSPLDALVDYRMNPSVAGATLGVNAILARGPGAELRSGTFLDTSLKF